ncbi:hypothetical protein [Prevotella corporis]|uniref:hypothetical protein n=1 Tax=Prevotella corporis TaxID=28128 RepID=UPI0023F94DA9|nr:hypothetical protein [Prevotella corporis]
MTIRALVFWALDFLRGGGVRKNCKEILDYLENNIGENDKQLAQILSYSVKNVGFYRKYKNFTKLQDFPVINKMIIKEHEAQFLSPQYDKSKLYVEETSGSTGTPLKVYQDPIKRKRAVADTIVFSKIVGYDFGSRLYYSRVWNDRNKKSLLQAKKQNIIMHESANLSDEELKLFLMQLEKDNSKKSVLLFASTLAALYQYMIANQISTTAKVEVFITISESLATAVRHGIEKLFNTRVVSRYSDSECGILSQQCVTKDEFHINSGSFYIELLKLDSDEAAKDGEVGRIVVTDLYNHAMPIIRYDTGDLGVISHTPQCGHGAKVFTRVDGRRIDNIFSTSGEVLSPYIIINTLWKYTELKQYQFIQYGEKEYELKLNKVAGQFVREVELIGEIKAYIGEDAHINIRYVDEIPLLASGKRKQVVNNYKTI